MSLREAWARVVLAEDYEGHMADVGQAQANASLVHDLIEESSLEPGSRILFAGCGPGQMFEYGSWNLLKPFDLTFTDINAQFVARTEERANAAGLQFRAVLDDVESPMVVGPFELVVLVLVLEHVDWRKALRALGALQVDRFLIVLQKNPENMETNVSPHRTLRGSLAEASKGEEPHLIKDQDLLAEMIGLGYVPERSADQPVPDEKFMCGRVFRRSPE
jgi:SAM-dependent methyltransferase